MKKKFREMQEEQLRQQEFNRNRSNATEKSPSKSPAGDYIDFEEVK